ncbi:MAG: hypothetical protein J5962_01250, partial [Lachnospiraceae bacterium]|nr:hypothetical protein [Lachnospiraceae bacterium]
EDYRIWVEDPIQTDQDATGSNAEIASDSDARKNSKNLKTTYSEVEMDGEDPYAVMFADLEFADGEWKKDIRISAVDDDEHEPEEILFVMICDVTNGEYLDSANRTVVCVNDNEEALDSEMGFEVESI